LRSAPRSALGGGNSQFSLYLVALTGIGMLSTTAIVVAEDTFGPIADNAQGIAEMAGVFEGRTEEILDGLDTVGNTTKAVTKGFAIGTAVIAAVALFASVHRDHRRGRRDQHRRAEDVHRRHHRRRSRVPLLARSRSSR
jgi:Na+/H+-translocating membrane pyrophosphatase